MSDRKLLASSNAVDDFHYVGATRLQLAPKQVEVLQWVVNSDQVVHLWVGAIRSLKSVGSGIALLIHMSAYTNKNFLLCGASIGSLERNALPILEDNCRKLGLGYTYSRSRMLVSVGSNKIWLYGGKDASSERYVRGITAAGAWFEELADLPENFVWTAVSRCSVEGAKIFMTMNKVGPYHWTKTKVADRIEALHGKIFETTLEDNPFVTKATKDFYATAFTGHYKKRMIDNEWSAPTGAVYPVYGIDDAYHDYTEVQVAVDWGTASPTAALFFGKLKSDGKPRAGKAVWQVFGEYYYDGSKNPQLLPEDHVKNIYELLHGYIKKTSKILVDPSATALKVALRQQFIANRLVVLDAKNSIDIGVQATQGALENGKILISTRCENLIQELENLVWDETQQAVGIDKPIKKDDHATDALRYFALYHFRPRSSSTIFPLPEGL